jgi:phage baseplate assembly protein W
MATFIGFNTINQYKKFTLTDFDLIKRDLSNAFNIQQGTLPGRPGYGTLIWSYVFENLTPVTEEAILNEVQRVVQGDPRLAITNTQLYPQQNGILIELQVVVVPSSSPQNLSLLFDQQSRQATFA